MPEPEEQTNRLRGVFSGRQTPEGIGNARSFKRTEHRFYGLAAEDEIIKRFALILRTGEKFAVPYSLLPIIKSDGGSITIMAHDLLITIEGRNLKPVFDAFFDEALLWVKESASAIDDGREKVFIHAIKIKGETIEH